MKKKRGALLLLLGAVIWGFAFVAQSVGMDYVGPFTFQSVRSFLGAAALLPVILIFDGKQKAQGTRRKLSGRDWRKLLAGGAACGTAMCVASCFQQVGIQYTTTAKAGFITSLYVVLVPVFSVVLGRRLKARMWGCVAVALAGLYLLSMGSGMTAPGAGDVMLMICAAFFAVQILLVDYFVRFVDGLKLSCLQFLVSGLLSGVVMLAVERPTVAAVLSAWAPILYAGVLSCGVGYTLQIIGQRDTEPTTATLLMSLESVFSLMGGALILRQIPTPRELAGCALVFGAVLATQLTPRWEANDG